MRTVLVVDDDASLHQLIAAILLIVGDLRIESAYNGREALEKAKQLQPDMIISDINMPVLNGFQLRDTFNLDPLVNFKRIPYLFFSTAPSHPDVISDPITSNIQGIFKKPVKHSEWRRARTGPGVLSGGEPSSPMILA